MKRVGTFRVGWLVRDRKDRGCHRQKTLRAALLYLPAPPPLFSFHLLARSYIRRCGFEIIFMPRRQRPPRSTVCIYTRAYIEDRRRHRMQVHPVRDLNCAISRISRTRESFRRIVTGYDSLHFARRDFFCCSMLESCRHFFFTRVHFSKGTRHTHKILFSKGTRHIHKILMFYKFIFIINRRKLDMTKKNWISIINTNDDDLSIYRKSSIKNNRRLLFIEYFVRQLRESYRSTREVWKPNEKEKSEGYFLILSSGPFRLRIL